MVGSGRMRLVFPFFWAFPAITIAGLVELKDALAARIQATVPLPLLVGIGSAAVVSWLAIDWLLKFLQRHSTWIFVLIACCSGVLLLVWWSFTAQQVQMKPACVE